MTSSIRKERNRPYAWRAETQAEGMPVIVGPNGKIANVHCPVALRSTPEGTAEIGNRARLLAAAPELLHALNEADAALALLADHYTGRSRRAIEDVREVARAILAKVLP